MGKVLFLPPLQPLVLWQSISLFWFCGLLAARFPVWGMSVACLLLLLDKRLRVWPSLLAVLCVFIGGIVALLATVPERPLQPT